MRNRGIAAALCCVLSASPTIATAQQTASTTAEAPDYSKYFFFQKAGVSRAKAEADFAECSEYGANVRNMQPGNQIAYVPYMPNVSPLAAGAGGALGGMIGALIADALILAPERRAMRRTILRKCMAFKGYSRFGIDESRWKALDDGDDKQATYARFAELAAGPAPQTGVLPQ